jgi:hypothetical protein
LLSDDSQHVVPIKVDAPGWKSSVLNRGVEESCNVDDVYITDVDKNGWITVISTYP